MSEFRTIDRGDIKKFVDQTKWGMFRDVTISDFSTAYRKIFSRQHNITTSSLPNNDNEITVI